MSKEEVIEEVVENAAKLVESSGMASADGLYISKAALMQNIILVGAFGGAIGGVVAYFVAKKSLTTKYEAIAAKEIAEAKAFYNVLHKKDEFSTPEKAVMTVEAIDAIKSYQGEDDVEENDQSDEGQEDNVINVFRQHAADENFDLEEEMKKRSPDHPYILSQEEFLQAEPGFDQITITYYEGDGTLADDQDQEIPFVDPIVGEENLQMFGHGSGDSRILYIRNERLSTDYEVLLSDGKYAHEVLGLEHADGGSRGRRQENQLRKFRGDDE